MKGRWTVIVVLAAVLGVCGSAGAVMPNSVMHMSILSVTPGQNVTYGSMLHFQAAIVGNVDVTATPGTPFPVKVVRYGPVRAGAADWSSEEKIMIIPHPNQPQQVITFSNTFPVTAKGAYASAKGDDICFILLQGTVQVSPKACVQWSQVKINPQAPLAVPQLNPATGEQRGMRQGGGQNEAEQKRNFNPAEIRGFNPQPEPPARDSMPIQNIQNR